jgi:DNA-binding transcriptional regulator YdaS (Cro superfamily)
MAGLNMAYLYQCLHGLREMSPAQAVRVEKLTNGELDRSMLCTKSWRDIWPEWAAKRETVEA